MHLTADMTPPTLPSLSDAQAPKGTRTTEPARLREVFAPQSRRSDLIAAYPELDAVCDELGFGDDLSVGEWSRAPTWALLSLARAAIPPAPQPPRDWSMATIPELIWHIVDTHHRVLHNELKRLQLIIDNLADAQQTAVLIALRKVFTEFRNMMLAHLGQEELGLFPLCIKLEEAALGHCAWDDQDVTTLVRYTGHCHIECDSGLRRTMALAEAAAAFTNVPDLAVVAAGLAALAQDLEIHTAKESELLIPAAIFAEERIRSRAHRPRTHVDGGA